MCFGSVPCVALILAFRFLAAAPLPVAAVLIRESLIYSNAVVTRARSVILDNMYGSGRLDLDPPFTQKVTFLRVTANVMLLL